MTTRRTTRRAFTLLEVVIATTVMGLLTLLISALNAQLRDWSVDAAEGGESLRVQRAVEFMRDQWAGRVSLPGRDESIQTSPAYLSFVTTRPALDPAFPVVRATYRWVAREAGEQRVFDLVYEEAPVAGVGIERRTRKKRRRNQRSPRPPHPPEPRGEGESRRARRTEEPVPRDRAVRERARREADQPAHRWTLVRGRRRWRLGALRAGGIILRNDEASTRGRRRRASTRSRPSPTCASSACPGGATTTRRSPRRPARCVFGASRGGGVHVRVRDRGSR